MDSNTLVNLSNMELSPIPILAYDPQKKMWIEQNFQPNELVIKNKASLKFLTYNIWFGKQDFNDRGIELRKIMEQSQADYICLQEVILESYQYLLREDWVRERYYISQIEMFSYHTIILSRIPCKFWLRPLMTGMGRYFLYAENIINGRTTAVGTVHLESSSHFEIREKQILRVFEILNKYDQSYLMGDFNLDGYSEQQKLYPTLYQDLWHMLHPDDIGFTRVTFKGRPNRRLDRILAKKTPFIEPLTIERVGMDDIPKYQGKDLKALRQANDDPFEELYFTPSDHYGLIGEIRLSKSQDERIFDFENLQLPIIDNLVMWVLPNLDPEHERMKEFMSNIGKGIKFEAFSTEKECYEYLQWQLTFIKKVQIWMDYETFKYGMKDAKLALLNIQKKQRDQKDTFKCEIVCICRKEQKEDASKLFFLTGTQDKSLITLDQLANVK